MTHEGCERLGKAGIGMPLSQDEGFLARLQRGNRVQVPRLIMWRHKLDPGEILDVYVRDRETYKSERFYARLGRDGRFTIPKLVVETLEAEAGDVMKVTLYASEAEEAE